MTRLADEYFKRDLSEAEEQQLSEELASSSEEAQLMAEHMGELYAQTGLPVPVWQDRPLTSSVLPGKHGILKKIFPWSLALILVGILGYWGHHRFCRSTTGSLPAMNPSESLIQPPASEPDSSKDVNIAETKALRPVSKTVSAVQNRVFKVVAPARVLNPAGQSGIQPAPASPGRIYQELSVVVDLPQSALATVRVYDHLRNEIRTLYAGILPQGKRTFAWDGKDEAGLVAPPGAYSIEVKSGEKVMRQEVRVEADQSR